LSEKTPAAAGADHGRTVGAGLDRITVTGIGAVGYHGVFDQEKRVGQPFFVDLSLFVDLTAAGRSDDLRDTINYGEIAESVKDVIVGESFNLVEALAQRIADDVLRDYPARAVEVTVHKPKAPIEVTFADVSVTIHRERTCR
jgi:dihydroneopterin aldolase